MRNLSTYDGEEWYLSSLTDYGSISSVERRSMALSNASFSNFMLEPNAIYSLVFRSISVNEYANRLLLRSPEVPSFPSFTLLSGFSFARS